MSATSSLVAYITAHTTVQIIRPQTLPLTFPWVALPVRSRGGYEWEGMDQLEGGEAHYRDY